MEKGAITHLAPLLSMKNNKDSKLKRYVLSCLGQIAKHSVELAELVVGEGEVLTDVRDRLKDPDPYVSKHAATLIREICKHTPEVGSECIGLTPAAICADCEGGGRGCTRRLCE